MAGNVLWLLGFLSSRSPVDWSAVIESHPLSLRMFWGWGSPACIVPPLFGGACASYGNRQILNCNEHLMVCFLFPVGLWRRIVLKLVTNRKFQPCVLQLSCRWAISCFLLLLWSRSFCWRQFDSFSREKGQDTWVGRLVFCAPFLLLWNTTIRFPASGIPP